MVLSPLVGLNLKPLLRAKSTPSCVLTMGTVTYSHTPWFLSYFSSHLQHCLFDVLFPNWPVHFMKVGLMSAFLRALPPTPSTGPGTPKGICWLDEAKQDWVSQLPPPLNILYKPMIFNKIQRHSSIPLEGKLQYDFSISSIFFLTSFLAT